MTMIEWALRYASMGLSVFPLRERDKRPAAPNGFKDATTDNQKIRAWWAENSAYNIGIATGSPSGGVVAVDLDADEDRGINGYETLRAWQKEHGSFPDTWQSITGRGGYHIFFHSLEPVTSRAGLYDGIDIRGEGGYIVAPPSIHPNGNRYEWEQEPGEYGLAPVNDLVHAFLNPRKATGVSFKTPEIIPEGKRNDTLFKLACSMRARGDAEEAILAALSATNAARCSPPLTERELDMIFKSAMRFESGTAPYRPAQGIPHFFNGKRFLHNVMGDYLTETCGVCKINNAVHIYDNGIYRPGEGMLHGKMVELLPEITDARRKEVYKYIKVNPKTPVRRLSPPHLIPFKSRIYDLKEDTFIDYGPEHVFLNRFPYDYRPDAPQQPGITGAIAQIAGNDTDIMSLLYEAIGNCFYLINSFRGAVALYGKGSNGKSTLLNIIIQLLGPENVSALSLQDTAERFRLSQIYGKAANVGDDISGAYLPDTSTFKKLVTGEYVTAEKKGQDPFQFRSFAKIFFAMNELPRANDKSKGFFGRLLIVPLTQDFSQNGKRDVGMKDRTWTRAEMEYLTRLAVEGLKRLIQQGDFTRPQSVVDAVAVYEAENNPVKMFLEEYGESFGSIEGRPREVVYSEYCFWCVKNGFKTGSATSFSREIHNLTGMVTKPRRLPHSGGKVVRCFCQ